MKAVAKEERRVAYPLVLIFLLLAAGIATAATGLLALLGWVLDLSRLASFGADLIPMAPGTALLFLLYGVAVCLRTRTPLSHRTFRISVAMVGLGTMVALLLFALGCLNIHWEVEHLGLNITHTVGEVPIGHMSPVAAFCFLLASVSFLGSLSQSATRSWRTALALGAAGALVGTCYIFLLAYLYGAPLLYGGRFIPPALNTVLAFVMLGLALLALAGRPAGLSGGSPAIGSRTEFAFALIFVLLAAGIVTVGYRYYRNYERNYYSEAERQLAAIADLKVGELVQYRKERLWDAGAFLNNDAFSVLVQRFLKDPEDVDAQWQIQEWAGKLMATDKYDHVRLLDDQGVTRLSSPVGLPPVSSFVSQSIPEILRSGQVTFQDFHRNEQDQRVYLNIMVPIFDEQNASRPVGIFYLRIDPDKYLYPFIKRWPTPSRTAETLLVRREGNEAVFLNELRFQTNTALSLRSSLENTNMPAVKAALGQEGIVEGVDYRGVPVIAAVRAVSDSPWFLVAKMDTAEVYVPLHERLRLTVLLVSLLLIGAGAGIGVIWWHQRVQFYKDRYKMAEALREGEARYRVVVDSANDAIVTINSAGEIAGWNGAAQKIFHYTAAEMLGQPLVRILPRAGHNHFFTDLQRIQAGGSPLTLDQAVELAGQRKDGSVFPMEISVAEWRVSGERFFTGTLRDITARKRAEVARRENEERLRSHTDNSPMAVVEWSADLIITRWTGAAEKMFGWSAEEAIGKPITELPGICEEDLPIVQSAIQQLAAGVSKQVFSSNRNRTRNGQVIHCEWYNSVLHDAGGKMTSVLSQILDITARKRAEEALRESQALYYSLVEQLPVGVFRKDPAGRYVLVNPWFCRLKGMKAEEFLGKIPQEVAASEVAKQDPTGLAVEHAAVGGGHHEQIMQTGKSIELVEEYTDADGRKQFVHAMKLPVFDLDGKVIGTQGLLFDITEIKQAAEALYHEQTLMATLMKTLPDPVYFKDAASRFFRVNPALVRKLGLGDPAQLVGKTDADFFTEEHASKALADEQEIIRTGQPLMNIEEKETWPDGSETWVLSTKLPLRDDAGRIIGTCGISSNITEIKRAEETLRLSEERLLKVITQTRCILHSGQVEGPEGWRERALEPDSPFRWDFPMQNEEAAQKVVPLELAPGERYLEAWIRNRNRADQAQMNWISGNAFLNDLPFYRNEFRCIDKHGVGHWMQEFVTIRKLAENRWEVFSITTDISDLKRVETELRRSETGLQATLESTADGILAVDNKGKVIKANRRFAELWRIPQSLMDAGDDRALLDFVLKQLSDPDAFLKKVQLLYSTDAVEMDTLAFKDGRIFERYTSPMMMEGAVIGRVWSFRDITERKQAAQRVADALNFNQTVLRASPVGIAVFKAAGPCISANEAIGQIIGGSREEVLKQNFRQLESWKDSGMLAAAEAALAAQTERKLENQIVTTFGRKAWFSCRFVPFHYEGEPHLLLIIGDITERKRQEEELKQKNSELERFTYTVSHDLKSPLVTVKTFLGYLEQDLARPDMERVKQDVAYMHTATEKMGQLLDELLNLARVGRKKNPAVRVTFRELAQEAVRLVAGRISTGGVKVQVADAVVTLEGDRPRLMEIWQNLVENACKFMGNQSQPQVEIGVEKRGPETVFFVRDNGAGIDPRYQAKVFGLFEQLNPKGEGTGMGLALVKRIVELYEGRIWVESAGPGQGANFLFTLPGAVILEPEQSS
jgi:PAS domain S-box-containing protein